MAAAGTYLNTSTQITHRTNTHNSGDLFQIKSFTSVDLVTPPSLQLRLSKHVLFYIKSSYTEGNVELSFAVPKSPRVQRLCFYAVISNFLSVRPLTSCIDTQRGKVLFHFLEQIDLT